MFISKSTGKMTRMKQRITKGSVVPTI